jgi:hypothetical protein
MRAEINYEIQGIIQKDTKEHEEEMAELLLKEEANKMIHKEHEDSRRFFLSVSSCPSWINSFVVITQVSIMECFISRITNAKRAIIFRVFSGFSWLRMNKL